MKHVTVEKVFKQGPEREAGYEQNDKGTDRSVDRETFPDKENDYRQVNSQHRHRRDFTQTFQNGVIKQPDITPLGSHVLRNSFCFACFHFSDHLVCANRIYPVIV
jgi:hypothetical protein